MQVLILLEILYKIKVFRIMRVISFGVVVYEETVPNTEQFNTKKIAGVF